MDGRYLGASVLSTRGCKSGRGKGDEVIEGVDPGGPDVAMVVSP